MSKLSLNTEALRVESFPTAPAIDETPDTPMLAKRYGTSRCAFTDCTCGFTVCQVTA